MRDSFYLFEDLQNIFSAKQRPKILSVLRENNIKYLIDGRGLPMVPKRLLDDYGVIEVAEEKEEYQFT